MNHSENSDQIKELVQQQFSIGNKVIAYLDEDGFQNTEGLQFFNNGYEAAEFCYENSTDFDHYRMISTDSFLKLLDDRQEQNKSIQIKNIDMNQENYDYLKNQVKFTGFGEGLENELKAKIEKNEPTFQLNYEHKFGKDEAVATLNFRKSDQQDMYFFNNYHMAVKQDGQKDPVAQTFYVGKENNFTVKEAYNLLSGRAVNKDLVNKEGQGYNSWVQLNFKETENSGNYKLKHYTEAYGFDLKGALEKLPIKEMAVPEDRAKLIDSLEKGNRQSATFLMNGTEQKRFIEANPQYKSITVYDGNMKRIRNDQKEGESSSQSTAQENRKAQKQDTEESAAPKAKNRRSKSQHV